MNSEYNAQTIEQQAQQYWLDNQSFEVVEDNDKEKFYCLSMLHCDIAELSVKVPTSSSMLFSLLSIRY